MKKDQAPSVTHVPENLQRGALSVAVGSASGPTVEEALQYADGLPADCWADRCIIELAAEVGRLRVAYKGLHGQVGGYLHGVEWNHWQQYNEPRYAPAAVLPPNADSGTPSR